MTFVRTPLAVALGAAFALMACPDAHAQAAAAAPPAAASAPPVATSPPQVVEVTGIRASLEKSLSLKRNADSAIEAISAEDIGKLPDKNVADAVQRVPGVNISSSAAGEGGFSENDRVSIRGTSPSLTQTLVNGHAVATGDWFVLDQTGTVGRSVSYSLLPSEIVNRVLVHKSATADLVEGGAAGAVDVETRTPLSFKAPFTAQASAQLIHADLPSRTDPQLSALASWHNDAATFGVLLQAFRETRHERRDGQEFLGYETIHANDADGNPTAQAPIVAAHPDLEGAVFPQLIGSSLFEQVRVRKGGLFDIEAKPTNDLTLDFNGFYSHLAASNYNRNFMAFPQGLIDAGISPDSYTLQNGTLTSATFNPDPTRTDKASGPFPGIVDSIYRPGAASETWYLDFDGKWRASDALTLTSKVGMTRGSGQTPGDIGYEVALPPSAGVTYAMHGLAPAVVTFPGADTATFDGTNGVGTWGSYVQSTDREAYGQLDADWAVEQGVLDSAKFGVRYAQHHRVTEWPFTQNCSSPCTAVPAWNGTLYPSNFGSGFGAGSDFLRNVWQIRPQDLYAFYKANYHVVPGNNWPGELDIEEKDSAAYGMLNFVGKGWRGNAGVRLVRTQQASVLDVPGGTEHADNPFGAYSSTVVRHTYTDALPSANLRIDLQRDLLARFAVSRTMARADYSALSGAVSLDDLNLSGSGGNPDLKPIVSNNLDAGLEWYFAPHALLSVAAFRMDLRSYVDFGVYHQDFVNQTLTGKLPAGSPPVVSNYAISAPTNTSAKVSGVEVGWEQPIGGGFGFSANYTYADGRTHGGGEVVGASKHTGNLEGYFENDSLSLRLAWTFRSSYLVGLDNSFAQHEDGSTDLAASVGYKLTDRWSLTFDGLNLNNPTLKYYGDNRTQPRALYSSGRQYYVGIRYSL